MEARTPDKLHPLWVQAHNMGDLDGMMALCEPEVCFVTWPAAVSRAAMLFVKPTERSWKPSPAWSSGPKWR